MELKAECFARGLKGPGNKQDLCARLDRDDMGQSAIADKSAAGLLDAHGNKKVIELQQEIQARNAGRLEAGKIKP